MFFEVIKKKKIHTIKGMKILRRVLVETENRHEQKIEHGKYGDLVGMLWL